MTKREMFKRFSCHRVLENAMDVANAAQRPGVMMVVVQADGYFIVFNQKVVSKAYDELKALPVVYEAWAS